MGTAIKSTLISLPKSFNAYLKKRSLLAHRNNPSDYIEDLVKKDMTKQKNKQKAEQQLEQLLLDGINSGPATRMSVKRWEKFRVNIETKIEKRKTV